MAQKKLFLVTRALAAILCLIGITLFAGGVRLVQLGGSAYYLITGLTVLISGILVWRLDRRGVWLYVLMLVGTLLWAFWEVGLPLDGWALAPRLIGPFILGLAFLLPPVRRALFGTGGFRFRWIAAACVVLIASVALVAAIASRDEADAPLGLTPEMAGAIPDGDWPEYGRDAGGLRYSPLADIQSQNVGELKVAWTFHTGLSDPRATFEATPIKIGDGVYFCDGSNRIFALDPDTGRLKWRFDPKADSSGVPVFTCRGVTYFRTPAAPPGSECAERIYTSTMDARLWAVDARTGKPCSGFGAKGVVDLRHGLSDLKKGYNLSTSAPTIVRGKIVLANWVKDNSTSYETAVVRAYDAVTGTFSWAWDIGRPGVTSEPAKDARYSVNTPNVWAPMSADEKLGLIYMPTGNGIPDFWGGARSPEVDKYAAAIVAVDAETGMPRWSFQTAHHDLWDLDVPAQPTLVDWPDGRGGIIPALVQPTKRAETFVLDRRTGRPIVPVHERPVPQGAAAGDRVSPTQPFSELPSFFGPSLTEKMMWGLTPLDQLWCRIKFREADYRGPMTPPGVRPFISYPGYGGGSNWGGISIDPRRRLMVINVSRFAMYGQLIRNADIEKASSVKPQGEHVGAALIPGVPFVGQIGPFMSPLGTPCQQPPFGEIGVVDLKTRSVKWSAPFGTARDSGPMGLRSHLPLPMGTPNMGGALTTRSGLLFIGATLERRFRALNIESGRELWSAPVPAGAHATPMTYRSDRTGRQFVVIASGGGPLMGSGFSDTVTAYALPDKAH